MLEESTSGKGHLLVEPEWLQGRIGDPSIRIIDTSVDIIARPPSPCEYKTRYFHYLEKHIPSAAYLYMVNDFFGPEGRFSFALPADETVW